MEAAGQGCARRPSGDVGASQLCEELRGIQSVEGEPEPELVDVEVEFLVRACPGCDSKLKHNKGNSYHPLTCDGAEHEGSKSIRNAERFSCFACGM